MMATSSPGKYQYLVFNMVFYTNDFTTGLPRSSTVTISASPSIWMPRRVGPPVEPVASTLSLSAGLARSTSMVSMPS